MASRGPSLVSRGGGVVPFGQRVLDSWRGLASKSGTVTMRNGDTLKRLEDPNTGPD
jgi:hypothetical protein